MNLRTKTIIGIAAIEIVMLVVLVLSAMSYMGSSNEEQLFKRAHATATMFSHAIKDAVLTTDLATLEDLITDLITLEDVEYVRVVRFEELLSQGGDPAFLGREIAIDENLESIHDGIFDTRVDIISDGVSYGYIEVGFSTSAIDIILDNAQKAFVGIASLEVLLVALFSFILGNYLTRNLIKLKKAAHSVSQRGPGLQIDFNQNDEIGEVAEAFNAMSSKLAENYRELKVAREEAERANESKSRFLASMSHEIRTPMNGVLGLLASLKRTPLNKNQIELVSTASESGHLLLSLINNILDLSRMEADNVTIDKQDFDLNKTVQMVVNSFMPAANAKNIKIDLKNNLPSSYFVGDVNRYKQILLNLIGNALKFTETGTISIDLDGELLPDNQMLVTCKITDTGIGIDKEAIPTLFDEFTMVDQTFSRVHEGSGLGLSICRQLIMRMNGEISVTSELGVGTCFSFKLPFEVSDQKNSDYGVSKEIELDPSCLGRNILIAEDNRANQLVVKHLFTHIGLEIDIAENGREAFDMVNNSSYDIIFMDISMPEMDGIQTCSAIRSLSDPVKANLPIIAFTAHALTGDKEKFVNAGMTDYLSKPVNMSDLVQLLNRHISNNALEGGFKPTTDLIIERETNYDTENYSALKNEDALEDEQNNVVDESILIQIINDTSAETLPVLIEHYIAEANQHIEAIISAKQVDDYEKLKFESHTLSSSSMALGNKALSLVAREVEKECTNGNVELASTLVDKLIPLAHLSLDLLHKRKMQGFE